MRVRARVAASWVLALARLLALLLVPAGCPGQGAAPGRPSASDEPGRASGGKLTPATEAEAHAAAVAEASPLPDGLVLAAEPERDGVGLVIQNRSERAVELVIDASVERVGGTTGAALPASSTAVPEALRLDCAPSAARCLSLVPGAELRPALWPGAQARAQCGSGTRAAAAPGRYRFAVRACNAASLAGARTSEPFEVP